MHRSRLPSVRGLALVLPALSFLLHLPPLEAQDAVWNAAPALELVERARELRHTLSVDSLYSYRSDARGYVYFFLDRNDSDQRTLVKTDQVALEVYWRAPNQTRQRIVGLRDRKALPTNIRYHLDHLTVVQDEFADRIRLGDGDEVEAVPHPMAGDGVYVYDYRLADSLTLETSDGRSVVRVYEVEVRPKDTSRPGFVGSVYLDRATAAIVRMTFTFTPASYVDPYLDYIRISLDNALWLNRYWLPYRQEIELRRELPQLDFMAGSVIRGRFEIHDYHFNEALPDALFGGQTVLALPPEQLRSFPFERSIYAGLEAEGLDASPAMEELSAHAHQLVRDRALTGLAPLRMHWSSVSDAIRHNRAEGLYLGVGATLRTPASGVLRLHGGWSFGRDDVSARLELAPRGVDPSTRLVGEWRRPRDIGRYPPGSRLLSSLASLAGEDWDDPYFVSGVRLEHRFGTTESPHFHLAAGWEAHRSGYQVIDPGTDLRRPVRPVTEGEGPTLSAVATWPGAVGPVDLQLGADVTHLADRSWGNAFVEAAFVRLEAWRAWSVALRARAGTTLGADVPPQALHLLGGRGTLPGHPHRALVGDRHWLADARLGRSLHEPWIGVHVLGAVGEARLSTGASLPLEWDGDPRAGVRGSVGAGVDLLWEVISLDLVRGIGPGGEWAIHLSVHPRFHPWL